MDTVETKEEVLERLKKENPGTELWLGEHPRTGDWWVYRPATPHEVRDYRKLQRDARDKSEDYEDAYRLLVVGGWNDDAPAGAVVYPPKRELKKLLLLRGFLAATMSAEICDVTGLVNDVVQKKL